MLLKRFYDTKLAQASYLVGCQRTGEALVIDPNRDVDQYILAAEEEGLRVTHVTETHIHADFVSGTRELASRTGATKYLSGEGGPDWSYAFVDEDTVLVADGDEFMVGNVKVEVMHTPGHTPEHIVFMITDTAGSSVPMGVFTGDFIFVGDVGRPDLLERAAGVANTMEAGARSLFGSLKRFELLPDYLQLWPGHGAGSACGKALGAVPSTTLGYERIANWAIGVDGEARFIESILAGQPEPPKYFAQMKRINKEGPAILNGFSRPPEVPVQRLPDFIQEGAAVIDTRHAGAFAEGHLAGTINIPLNRSFNTWAGWLIPYDRDIYLITDEGRGEALNEAVRDLAMIGLDRVAGHVPGEALESWHAEGAARATVPMIDVAELARRMEAGDITVVDVRGASEWQAGHLPGVPNIPVGYLADRYQEIPTDRPVALHCQSGGRSAIGVSLLQSLGVPDVINVVGGYVDWRAQGLPIERPEPEQAAV